MMIPDYEPGTRGPMQAGDGLDDSRVSAAIDVWKRRLLDLTKRNRSLNFRMNPVSTLAIVNEQPAAVFRQLWLDKRALRFKATKRSRGAQDDDTGAGDAAADVVAMSLGPYDSALDERHRDAYLETAATPDALDKCTERRACRRRTLSASGLRFRWGYLVGVGAIAWRTRTVVGKGD